MRVWNRIPVTGRRAAIFLVVLLMPFLQVAGTSFGAQVPQPVYRVPLLVHLGDSERPVSEFNEVFAEINRIWLSQAGICFEIEAVRDDRRPGRGLDMWFHPQISDMITLNGYYDGEDIQMTDHPVLYPAPHPARDGAARTAAHELGHALGLKHNQSERDNLMASKTYGWHLNKEEIERARQGVTVLALPDNGRQSCDPPRFIGFEKSK